MAQLTPFPAGFTQTAIIDLNSTFTTPFVGGFATQAFIETGSTDPFVFASFINIVDPTSVRSLFAQAKTDSSGDNGILVTLYHLTQPIQQFTCSIILLQKGALRYQNPRRFS